MGKKEAGRSNRCQGSGRRGGQHRTEEGAGVEGESRQERSAMVFDISFGADEGEVKR